MLDRSRRPPRFPPPFARAWGDDAHGLWAEFSVVTPNQDKSSELEGGVRVVQRLRWIEPGTFLMGSPPREQGRQEREGPQHPVTLNRGYWLADTACTQGLWQAVMGENPSHFKGDAELPVEQVSWNDVQGFLAKLQGMLRGCEVTLPTEAEWEHACRAGTITPFSFGEDITTVQVNYNGQYPYADGQPGEYRARTVPVRALPANGWGLYQMHGNVDEWCLDGYREYGSEAVVDPVGPMEEGAPRAVRGGSWDDGAVRARSAYRYRFGPGFRYRLLGFRLCLRSIEPSQSSGLRGAQAQRAERAGPEKRPRGKRGAPRSRK